MKTELKQKIAFALLMGAFTTGIVSFTLIALNLGFSPQFLTIWLRSWGIGYLVAIPAILFVGPKIQSFVSKWQ